MAITPLSITKTYDDLTKRLTEEQLDNSFDQVEDYINLTTNAAVDTNTADIATNVADIATNETDIAKYTNRVIEDSTYSSTISLTVASGAWAKANSTNAKIDFTPINSTGKFEVTFTFTLSLVTLAAANTYSDIRFRLNIDSDYSKEIHSSLYFPNGGVEVDQMELHTPITISYIFDIASALPQTAYLEYYTSAVNANIDSISLNDLANGLGYQGDLYMTVKEL